MQHKHMTVETFDKIAAMLARGEHPRVIAAATGFSASAVWEVKHGERKRPGETKSLPTIAEVLGSMRWTDSDPPPEVIAEACRKLRRHRPRPKVGAEVSGENYSFPVFSTTTLFGRSAI